LSSDDLQTTLRNGIDAAKRGDRTTARRLLEQVIARDDRNEMAWIWLASVVNTNAERRNALERVLQINPRNSRAREALAKLNEPAPTGTADQSRVRDTISRVREAQRIDTTAAINGGGGGSNLAGLLLLIGLIAAAVIVGVLLLNSFNQNTPDPVQVAIVTTSAPTPTTTFTPSPSPTPENRSAAEVTRINAPTLPPTFTPTEPPPPTERPTETATPIGLENFPMLYTSLNTGAAQPDLYSLNADGSNDGFLLEGVRDIAISPDGLQIAFVRDIPGSLAIVPPEEPTAAEEPTEVQLPTVADPNSSGDLGLPEAPTEVAEAAEDPNVQSTTAELAAEVFVASIDDLENPRQITSLGAADTSSPSFSPDGSLIVFSSSAGQFDSEVYIVESAGGTPRPLTNNEVIDRDPVFSPVANIVAYTSDQDSPGLTEIYTLPLTEDGNIDGGAPPRRITDASGSNYAPAWSFDGTRMVFVSDRAGSGDVYVVDNEIGGPGELVTIDDGDAENRSPALSPDGLWVAFISNRDSENFQVYLSDLRGFEVRRLTDNGRDDISVVFQFVDLSAFVTETE
jgi:Tol biopolymer transport system component